jgi:2-polyprenyl-3-methyl-5-hydroxy-6-metoxy-1,4-benzoquinol methylase
MEKGEHNMEFGEQYTYPDLKDEITAVFIGINEPYEGYWAESENYVLNIMKKHIEQNDKSEKKSLLDAGCGEGRLIPDFSKYFDYMLAIDPDKSRLSIAKETIQNLGISDKVHFDDTPIQELEEQEKFDVILCSHVLQHVHLDLVPKIIDKLKRILKESGLLFILTCHSTTGNDYFVKEFFDGPNFVEEIIDEKEFNSLVYGINQLPIHLFSRKGIEETLAKSDLEIIDYKVFHILEKDLGTSNISERDLLINQSPDLQDKYGRDVFVAARINK